VGPTHVHVAIAGAGFGGICTAIRLRQEGIHDFLVFEREAEIGGVWRDNTYPGCACDVESHLYSFSFAPNPRWSHAFSPQTEIREYLVECVDRFGVGPHLRLGHELLDVAWQEGEKRWRIETSRGVYTADVFVAAVGALSEPSIPTLPGQASFRGTSFHSARWNHAHDLTGRNVAVIGTGASAIQFVPQIQPKVGKLSLFQRTPPWIMPRNDRAFSVAERDRLTRSRVARGLMRGGLYTMHELLAVPFLHPRLAPLGEWMARRYLHSQVTDPTLRKKLTPTFRMGCKRILLSDNYFPAVAQPNVDLVTSGIRELRPDGILTEDGQLHPADTIIYGTGFQVGSLGFTRRVRGRDGVALYDAWREIPRAHLGTTVAGFPNLFFLLGPNTGLGHSSVLIMIEAQVEHLLNALRHLRAAGAAAVEPRAEAQAAFVADIEERLQTTVWQSGCKSWYLDDKGRNWTLWPGFTFSFNRRVSEFDPAEYVTR
jgi:cation diffusion facilitator CzcD-associated flavoprotein CzcO